jgi:hypothetical protein
MPATELRVRIIASRVQVFKLIPAYGRYIHPLTLIIGGFLIYLTSSPRSVRMADDSLAAHTNGAGRVEFQRSFKNAEGVSPTV